MTIKRDTLLNRLITAKNHNLIKILVGIRRCGKSFLLFNLFKQHLLESGVSQNHIIEIDLESPEFASCSNAIALGETIAKKLVKDGKRNFVLIDEIQNALPILPKDCNPSLLRPEDLPRAYTTFSHVLNGLLKLGFVDVYVTGSNAHLLSADVATEFRGRSETIGVHPLSMSEFIQTMPAERDLFRVRNAYLAYGGLPECALRNSDAEKRQYLDDLNRTIYLRDIADRHNLRSCDALEAVANVAMSNVGCLVNASKLSAALAANGLKNASSATVAQYLKYLESAFLLKNARLFDVRGNRYLDYPSKYYAVDTGIRNSRLNYRQSEFTHLMENAVFNELVNRGYAVDVGAVEMFATVGGKRCRKRYEVDFVVNKGDKRFYVQSAWNIPDTEKREQETFSLRHVGDNFRKIVVTGDPYESPWTDSAGITFMGLMPFLLNPQSLEQI